MYLLWVGKLDHQHILFLPMTPKLQKTQLSKLQKMQLTEEFLKEIERVQTWEGWRVWFEEILYTKEELRLTAFLLVAQ